MTEREHERQLSERAVKLAESLSEIPLEDGLFILEIAAAILNRRDEKAENDDRDSGEKWRAPG